MSRYSLHTRNCADHNLTCEFISTVVVFNVRLTIRHNAEAVLAILASVQAGDVSLLSSEALHYEVNRIPDDGRRSEVKAALALANEYLEITQGTELLAESLESSGIFPMDAIHLALASTADADFFCTCDAKLLRKCRAVSELGCNVVSVLGLVAEVLQ